MISVIVVPMVIALLLFYMNFFKIEKYLSRFVAEMLEPIPVKSVK